MPKKQKINKLKQTVAFTQSKEAIRYSTLEHRKKCKKIEEEATLSRDVLTPFKSEVMKEEMAEINHKEKTK